MNKGRSNKGMSESDARASLLDEVRRVSNPSFALDFVLNSLLIRLQTFFQADARIILIDKTEIIEPGTDVMLGSEPQRTTRIHQITEEMASLLLSVPAEQIMIYGSRDGEEENHVYVTHGAYDVAPDATAVEHRQANAAIAGALDSEAFLTVPLKYAGNLIGRLYLCSQGLPFDMADASLLLQAVDSIMPVVGTLAMAGAAPVPVSEPRRAALDLHDSHIQPLIGVQLGLIALREKLKVGNLKIADLDRLIEMTEAEITDLRERVNRLRERGEGETSMASGIKRIADKFGKASGINIEVKIEEDLLIASSLAADAFQMVGEALSNIRRHTESTHVVIAMQRSNGGLALQIVNSGPGPRPQPFTPRSITERAASVGGRAQIRRLSDGTTVLHIDMPLGPRNYRSSNDYGRYQGN